MNLKVACYMLHKKRKCDACKTHINKKKDEKYEVKSFIQKDTINFFFCLLG